MEEKKIVYMVQLDWANNDDEGVVTHVFDTYEKALKKFNAIIEEDKTLDWYWSKDAFDKDGNLDEENYELDTNLGDVPNDNIEHELWWNLKCIDNYYLHDLLELRIMEVE